MAEETKATKSTKEVANDLTNVREEAKQQAANNVITSRFGKTETFKINEGEDDEQTVMLQFPGTIKASDLMDGAANPFGNINRTFFMEQAIKNVIVAPKMKDLSWFDTHHGYNEVFEKAYSFLTEGLN